MTSNGAGVYVCVCDTVHVRVLLWVCCRCCIWDGHRVTHCALLRGPQELVPDVSAISALIAEISRLAEMVCARDRVAIQ